VATDEPDFELRVIATSPAAVRIVVAGEVDIETAPRLADALREEMNRDSAVVLDLAGVTFMDSSGLALLVEAINAAKVNGWNLRLRAQLSPNVRKTMELTAILPMLPLVED
jgi:anti-sigma B factor antagonist